MPPPGRFLLADELLTDRAIRLIQAECVRRDRGKEATAAYNEFAGWIPQSNQVMLYTLRTYADLALPKQFDCLFSYDDPAQFTRITCELTHSLWGDGFRLAVSNMVIHTSVCLPFLTKCHIYYARFTRKMATLVDNRGMSPKWDFATSPTMNSSPVP
jgi:hypothetical protein